MIAATASAAKTILIVDDEPDVRESLRDVVEAEGYQVAVAADGREAVAYLKSAPPPSLCLLDLMMPVMSGQEVLASIREDPVLATVPVVVLSAAARDNLEKVVATHKVAGYLQKPVELEELLGAIERFC